jgi:hypothetical protein
MKLFRLAVFLGSAGVAACSSPPPSREPRVTYSDPKAAAIIGESVANALAAALRLATLDPATGTWSAALSHDLRQGDSSSRVYKFSLPKLTEEFADSREGTNWVHHPGKQTAAEKPENEPAFEMGSDEWAEAILDEVRKTEPNDPPSRFAFSFRVRKINTLSWLVGKLKPDNTPYTLEDLDPLSKLYEFKIFAFRLEESENGKGRPRRLIGVVTNRVSTK